MAQNSAAEYQLKAVFLYNFTRFVEWPPTAFESYNDAFVIGIVGDDPFGAMLERTIADEMIGRHPIRIRRYNELKDIGDCHILFVNSGDATETRKILAAMEGKKTLTVSDMPNFARMGGMIGFYTLQNKIRMQINATEARKAGLSISSKLLSVAQVL